MKRKPTNSSLQAWAERCIRNDWAVREARARMHAASGDLIRLEKVHETLMAELTGLVGQRHPEAYAACWPDFGKLTHRSRSRMRHEKLVKDIRTLGEGRA